MKNFFETLAVSFGMFSAVPVPQPEWNDKNMRYALLAFPLVGVINGLLWLVWAWVCSIVPFPDLLRGAVFCLIPTLVTGGLHMDGYCDVSDALASWAPAEKRMEILKDSHCGAFAIIKLCVYFVGYLALCTALVPDRDVMLALACSFALSRSMAGAAMTLFPIAKNTGLAHTFASAAHKGTVRVILTLLSIALAAAMVVLTGVTGQAMIAALMLVLWHYHHTAVTKFAGINGDLSGWFVQRSEFWMLAALVVTQYIEVIL